MSLPPSTQLRPVLVHQQIQLQFHLLLLAKLYLVRAIITATFTATPLLLTAKVLYKSSKEWRNFTQIALEFLKNASKNLKRKTLTSPMHFSILKINLRMLRDSPRNSRNPLLRNCLLRWEIRKIFCSESSSWIFKISNENTKNSYQVWW